MPYFPRSDDKTARTSRPEKVTRSHSPLSPPSPYTVGRAHDVADDNDLSDVSWANANVSFPNPHGLFERWSLSFAARPLAVFFAKFYYGNISFSLSLSVPV